MLLPFMSYELNRISIIITALIMLLLLTDIITWQQYEPFPKLWLNSPIHYRTKQQP